ncbi:superoxide dismutase, Ni [Enterovibrio sp. ZSDZ35]|uniref:Superoxide dismutase, Ni n=1 Tax=Enterovibrio qingdaonensis TaxID=2899818 RepID=A0ABT5QI26_9GAMM|nr:superoxide dismutase, Ni [Enterovibrio sp. ZSDZ35]MDD1780632.1 superoxide dismutase, Ni [Enterovibrio sp. ZSDZ35]
MLHALMSHIDQHIKLSTVSAHCDIPCKIYDPIHAQIAALTIIRMIDLIEDLPKGNLSVNQHATLCRLVEQKDVHGKKVKEEICVIWGDYFKQPQFEEFPEIHALAHEIMLLASRAKQELNRDDALALLNKINRFAEIFWTTKGVAVYTADCPYLPSLPTVYPDLKP